jgi:class 3 adenylate cyclase
VRDQRRIGALAPRSEERPQLLGLHEAEGNTTSATTSRGFLARRARATVRVRTEQELGDMTAILQATERHTDPGVEAPRVFATVLFLDLVASTVHAARLGDRRWRDVLDAYDALVAECVEAHGGEVVKHTGDGSLALFSLPGLAVRCAMALARTIHRSGMELRAGVHCGELELRGADVCGIAIAIAHRVQSAAGPGEVLVSRTVADVVAGSDLALIDRGDHALKGLDGRWRLYAAE